MRYYPSFTSVLQYEESMKNKPISWLPVDSRLFLPLLNFGHVKGLARFFLVIEIVLAVLVVLGTIVIVIFKRLNPA